MRIHLTPKDIERFWNKVDRSGGPDACWPWTAGFSGNGYGNFWVPAAGGPVNAHRVCLAIKMGGYDPTLQALHTCDNRRCCNPGHLYAGTPQDNAVDFQRRRTTPRARLKGSLNGMSKLTEEEAQYIWDACASGEKGVQTRVAAEMGVCRGTVNAIVKGLTWPHIRRGEPR